MIDEIRCKDIRVFAIFVGHFHQSVLKTLFFAQDLTDCLVGKSELLTQFEIDAHDGHRA